VLTTPAAAGTYTLRAAFNGTTPIADSDSITIDAGQSPLTIAGFTFEGTGQPAGTVTLFGHAFEPGMFSPTDGLLLRRADNNDPLRTQMNPLSLWDDGSVKTALLAVELPALSDGTALNVNLRRGETHPNPGSNLSFATALAGRSVSIKTWAPGDTSTPLWTYDPLAAIGADRWHEGPLALSTRVETHVPSSAVLNTSDQVGQIQSVRLIVDVVVTSDGILEVDVCFSNDRVMHPNGGIARFGYTIEIDGQMVYEQRPASGAARDLLQYSQWIRRRGRGTDGTVYGVTTHRPLFRPDFDLLVSSGVQLNIDRSQPLAASEYTQAITNIYNAGLAAVSDPYHNWGLARWAGQSGGRPEIGYRTLANTLWLTTGDRTAQLLAQRQFEAAATRPMYYYDWELARWITPFDWPKLTLWSGDSSPAGTPRTDAVGLPTNQRQTHNTTDHITIDGAHHGSFNWTPALLSGRRLCYDSLVARASWAIIDTNIRANGGWAWNEGPHWRTLTPSYNTGNVLCEKPHMNQSRAQAWALRDWVDAASIIPDNHPQQEFCRNMPRAVVNAWEAVRPGTESRIGTAFGHVSMHSDKMGPYLFHESFWYYSIVTLARLAMRGLNLGGPNFNSFFNNWVKFRAYAATHPDFNYRNLLAGNMIVFSEQGSRNGPFATTWAQAHSYTIGYLEYGNPQGNMDENWTNTTMSTGGDWQRNVLMSMALCQEALAILEPDIAARVADAIVLFRSERRNPSNKPQLHPNDFFGSNYQLNAVCASGQSWQWNTAPTVRPGQSFTVSAGAPAGTVVGVVRTDGPIPRNDVKGRSPTTQAFEITSQPADNPFTISMGGVIRRSGTGTLIPGNVTITVRARTYDGDTTTGNAYVSAAVPVQVTVTA
jgi:hypothetical protein